MKNKRKKISAVCNACFDKRESDMIGERCIQSQQVGRLLPIKCPGTYIPFHNKVKIWEF